MFASDVVEVRLPVPLHELPFVDLPDALDKTSNPVSVSLSSINEGLEGHWNGQIVRTEAVMDRKNRVLYAIAEVADPYTAQATPLHVGSFVRAEIAST